MRRHDSKYLPKEEGFAAQLAEAMNYSMEAGGNGCVRS